MCNACAVNHTLGSIDLRIVCSLYELCAGSPNRGFAASARSQPPPRSSCCSVSVVLFLSCCFCHAASVVLFLLCCFCHASSVMLLLTWCFCHAASVVLLFILSCFLCRAFSVMLFLSCCFCPSVSVTVTGSFMLSLPLYLLLTLVLSLFLSCCFSCLSHHSHNLSVTEHSHQQSLGVSTQLHRLRTDCQQVLQHNQLLMQYISNAGLQLMSPQLMAPAAATPRANVAGTEPVLCFVSLYQFVLFASCMHLCQYLAGRTVCSSCSHGTL